MVHGVKDWRGNEYGVGDVIVYGSGTGGRSIQMTEATVLDIYWVAYSDENDRYEHVAPDYEGAGLRVKVQPLRDSRAYDEDGGRMRTDREYFSKSTGKKLTWAQAHGTYVRGRYVNPDGTDWERSYRFGRGTDIPEGVTYVGPYWDGAWPADDLEERLTIRPVPPVTLSITKNITLLERRVG